MSKTSPKIRSLSELRARKQLLRQQIGVAQQGVVASVTPTRRKLSAFLWSTIAPFLSVGAGIWLAYQLFSTTKEKSKTEETNKVANPNPAAKQALPTVSFIDRVRAWLPFIKALWPVIQQGYQQYQSANTSLPDEPKVNATE